MNHLLTPRNNARSPLKAGKPVSGTSIITFDPTGTRFALNQSIFGNDNSISFPVVSTIEFRVKALFDTLVQSAECQNISTTQFPIQQLSGFIIDRFPNPELMRFFEGNAIVHPIPQWILALAATGFPVKCWQTF
jgi:hypothetical protein